MRVVDEDQQRPRERVERVQAFVAGLERQLGRDVELSADQLAHDAEGEVALEHRADGAQHAALALRLRRSGAQQRVLP